MTLFTDVKAAIRQSPDVVLRSLGLAVEHQISGDWTPVKCPLCADSGGSASATPEGFLRCHQCNTKLDVFAWVGQRDKQKPYAVAVSLAKQLGVELRKVARRSGRDMPPRMTEEVLEQATDALWSAPAAGVCRDFLAERKLDLDPPLLAELGVGWIAGHIIFALRERSGQLRERYRGYVPNSSHKWSWFGRGTGGVGLWLVNRPVRDRILMLEGEWDVLTALVRLRMEDAGWSVVTWTGGASSGPSASEIPKEWRSKDVHLCYDNDVFQGADYSKYWAKDSRGTQQTRHLLQNLLGKISPMLRDHGCTVWIRQVPIDPREVWGGDFRDWVDRGGKNVDDLPCFKFDTLPPLVPPRQDLDFDDLWEGHAGEQVRTRAQVSMIAGDDYVFPTIAILKCQQGQLPMCASCAAPRLFPDGIVSLHEYQEAVTLGIAHQDLEGYLLKHVIKRPKSCPEARLSTVEGKACSYWRAVRAGLSDDTRQRSLSVVSTEPPSLSGEVEISGRLYSHSSGVVFMADQVIPLDRAEVDLTSVDQDLKMRAPHGAVTTEQIDAYLDYRWRDISRSVTRVHGRRDIHVACELLFHSVTGINVGGKLRRGWLDVALLGDTRSGKSMTMRGLIDWLHLGAIHSAVDNISRAGLIMGADHRGMLRPGLMTKSHRKLLALDEFHWLVNARTLGEDHPMSWMQSARDDGRVHGIKIYGDRALPARVRLMTISNWAKSRKRAFVWPCEHLAWLYGSPETLSRLDFGLIVEGPPSQQEFDEVDPVWNVDLTKALVLRAWAMEPHQVVIEKEAETLAFDMAESCRSQLSYDRVPLYTPEEKPYSILRIATAVANICFSHLPADSYSCVVRPVHVHWACEWLWHTWTLSGYDRYSAAVLANSAPDSSFAIEKLLTIALGLDDPPQAARVLEILMGGVSPVHDAQLLGLVNDSDRHRFFSQGAKVNALTPGKDADRGRVVLTDVGHDVAKKLAELARDDPQTYVYRYKRLLAWSGKDALDIQPLRTG